MKKLFGFIGGMAMVALCIGLYSYVPGPPGFASGCVGGSYWVSTNSLPGNVWQGKLDTINGTGTDTIRMACACNPKFITFTTDFYKVSGAATIDVALYASANGGITYSTTPITTFTVVPTNTSLNTTPAQYVVNATAGGNPNTNYMWVGTGLASNTGSWQISVMERN